MRRPLGWQCLLATGKAGSEVLRAGIIIMGIFRVLLVLKKGEIRRRILSRRG
jgi:hypothetical protein